MNLRSILVILAAVLLSWPVCAQEIDPDEVRRLLGEAIAASGDHHGSIEQYQRALVQNPADVKTKEALADVLSWERQYAAALKLYDELISAGADMKVRIKKARVLGWARQYTRALEEYQKVLELRPDERVALERDAKKAYWNGQLAQAAALYEQWIAKDPKDLEALFDLAEVQTSRQLWLQAREAYEAVLRIAPTHRQAAASLRKLNMVARQPSWAVSYEFVEADSASRGSDIKKHAMINELKVPWNDRASAGLTYVPAYRVFADHGDVTENHVKLDAQYRLQDDWTIGGYYGFYDYDRGLPLVHVFGAQTGFRPWDAGLLRVSHDRQRLENNSTVLREGAYRDDYKARFDLDMSKRWKAGVEEAFSRYSDSNASHAPAADIKYIVSFAPEALSLQYRYSFLDFSRQQAAYFSPRDFAVHAVVADWQHDFIRDEVFFGARRVYTDLACELSRDSEDIVSGKITGAFVWDMAPRVQLRAEAQKVIAEEHVYRDQRALVSAKVFF
jgi:tetratricopeptide (TPR) repeat protein